LSQVALVPTIGKVEEMDMHESDWRVFRRLHSIALERFCKRVLEVVREAAECKTDYHDCYRRVYGLIRESDKRMAAAFDDPRRSNAFLLLANIIGEGLLSAEELQQFSEETQERIKIIQELRGA
jgi:hypothetical protein